MNTNLSFFLLSPQADDAGALRACWSCLQETTRRLGGRVRPLRGRGPACRGPWVLAPSPPRVVPGVSGVRSPAFPRFRSRASPSLVFVRLSRGNHCWGRAQFCCVFCCLPFFCFVVDCFLVLLGRSPFLLMPSLPLFLFFFFL